MSTHQPVKRRRSATLAVLLLALPAAGCSAGHSAATPPVAASGTVSTGAVRLPSTLGDPGPPGTVYVGGADGNIYAFPLGASGPTAPSRTITPHAGPNNHQSVDALATLADGKLAILQRRNVGGVNGCLVIVEDADADGSPAGSKVQCDANPSTPTVPSAIARNAMGGFDLTYQDNTTFSLVLKRYAADGATLVNTMAPPTNVQGLATDAAGHDYLLGPDGEVRKYKATTTDGSQVAATYTVAGSGFRAIALAPDKTAYILYGDIGNENIDAVVNGVVTRTLGPFTDSVANAIAVDSLGELYVGLGFISSSKPPVVRVYAADANGLPPAIRVIRPAQALPCTCTIAISE